MDVSLLRLYQGHVLGDGHGMVHAEPAATPPQMLPEAVESGVQVRKRRHHQRKQIREIKRQIREFVRLGEDDHD